MFWEWWQHFLHTLKFNRARVIGYVVLFVVVTFVIFEVLIRQ